MTERTEVERQRQRQGDKDRDTANDHFRRVTVGVLILLCAAGTACGAIWDCKKRHSAYLLSYSHQQRRHKRRPQQQRLHQQHPHQRRRWFRERRADQRSHKQQRHGNSETRSGTGKSQNQLHGVTVQNTAALGEAKQAINEESECTWSGSIKHICCSSVNDFSQ